MKWAVLLMLSVSIGCAVFQYARADDLTEAEFYAALSSLEFAAGIITSPDYTSKDHTHDRRKFVQNLDIKELADYSQKLTPDRNAAFELQLVSLDNSIKRDPTLIGGKNYKRVDDVLFTLYDTYNPVYIEQGTSTLQACNEAILIFARSHDLFTSELIARIKKGDNAKALELMLTLNPAESKNFKHIVETIVFAANEDNLANLRLLTTYLSSIESDPAKILNGEVKTVVDKLLEGIEVHRNKTTGIIEGAGELIALLFHMEHRPKTNQKVGGGSLFILSKIAADKTLVDGVAAYAVKILTKATYTAPELRQEAQRIVIEYLKDAPGNDPQFKTYQALFGTAETEALSLKSAARFAISCDGFFLKRIPKNILLYLRSEKSLMQKAQGKVLSNGIPQARQLKE